MAGNTQRSMNKVMDIYNAGMDADHQRIQPVSVDIWVDTAAPQELVIAVRDAFLPVQPTSVVTAHLIEGPIKAPYARPDLCVIIGGGSDEHVRSVAHTYVQMGTPVAIVAESLLDAPLPDLPMSLEHLVGICVSTDYPTALSALAHWMVSACEKSTALAANFPFCRRAKVSQLVKASASQNAAVGAMGSKSGHDMASMTSNQAKLALDIAAAYGRPLTLARAQELVAVYGAGVGYRGVARAVSSAIPGMGWAFKAGVGYAGTLATANAIASHFERQDAGVLPLPRVRALVGSVAKALPVAGSAIQRGAGIIKRVAALPEASLDGEEDQA